MIARAKRLVAIRALPCPQTQSLRHTFFAKGMSASLDDRVFQVSLAHVAVRYCSQHFILLGLSRLGFPALELAARVFERGFEFFDFEFSGPAGGGCG